MFWMTEWLSNFTRPIDQHESRQIPRTRQTRRHFDAFVTTKFSMNHDRLITSNIDQSSANIHHSNLQRSYKSVCEQIRDRELTIGSNPSIPPPSGIRALKTSGPSQQRDDPHLPQEIRSTTSHCFDHALPATDYRTLIEHFTPNHRRSDHAATDLQSEENHSNMRSKHPSPWLRRFGIDGNDSGTKIGPNDLMETSMAMIVKLHDGLKLRWNINRKKSFRWNYTGYALYRDNRFGRSR